MQHPSLAFSNLGEEVYWPKKIAVSWRLFQWILALAGVISTESWIFCVRWICVSRQNTGPPHSDTQSHTEVIFLGQTGKGTVLCSYFESHIFIWQKHKLVCPHIFSGAGTSNEMELQLFFFFFDYCLILIQIKKWIWWQFPLFLERKWLLYLEKVRILSETSFFSLNIQKAQWRLWRTFVC